MSLLRRAIIAGRATPAPAPACAVTLTTDFMAAFGVQPAQIDGQRIFIEDVEDEQEYGASTDLNNPTTFWSSGTRWIESQDVQLTSAICVVGFVAPDGSRLLYVVRSNNASFIEWAAGGSLVATQSLGVGASARIAVGVDGATGDARVVVDDSEVSLPQDFDGAWQGEAVALYGTINATSGTSSGSVRMGTGPYQTDFSGVAGDNRDFCGGQI